MEYCSCMLFSFVVKVVKVVLIGSISWSGLIGVAFLQ